MRLTCVPLTVSRRRRPCTTRVCLRYASCRHDASVSAIRQLPPLLPTAEQWRDALRDEGVIARVPQQRASDAAVGCTRVRELHEQLAQGCDWQHAPPQTDLDTSLRADLRSEADFTAGACNAHSDVWALWAQLTGGGPRAVAYTRFALGRVTASRCVSAT